MTKSKDKHSVYVIGGPTASGKSAHALALAAEHDGVIINADSMQVYDGLPMLTAQPSAEDYAQTPHLLYGALHPNEDCSAGNWREMVLPLIHETLEKGKAPIIVGGSGLYLKALIEGLSPIIDIPPEIRDAAGALQQKLGNPAFHQELAKRDPVMAERLEPMNTARLVRAWEVLEATGKSLAEWQSQPRVTAPDNWEFHVTLVMPAREILYARCNKRFEWMLENGALEELAEFNQRIEKGEVRPNALLNHALGAEPLTAYLNGTMSKLDAITRAQGETRRYAKRQVTWFRNQIKAQVTIN